MSREDAALDPELGPPHRITNSSAQARVALGWAVVGKQRANQFHPNPRDEPREASEQGYGSDTARNLGSSNGKYHGDSRGPVAQQLKEEDNATQQL